MVRGAWQAAVWSLRVGHDLGLNVNTPGIFTDLELHVNSFSERNGYGGEPKTDSGFGVDARKQGVS